MRHSIVDIGSNTIRLIVFDVEGGDISSAVKVLNKKYTAGLITYVLDNELTSKGIKKLKKTLASIQSTVKELRSDTFSPFATASLRELSNTEEVLQEVKEELGIDIDVLSQTDEAKIGNIGITSDMDIESGITIDIGGGSTEIVSFKNRKPDEIINLKLGSLLLFREHVSYVMPTKKEIRAMEKNVKRELDIKNYDLKNKNLIGIGGTIRTAGKAMCELWTGDEHHFTLEDVKDLIERIKDKDTETARMIIRANPSRIHTLVPGIIILKVVMKKLKINSIDVSERGLREGYLIYKVLGEN